LLREDRFDLKLRIDFPNEAEREQILASQLAKKRSSRFDLNELALLTLGASPAKLCSLVEQAAVRGRKSLIVHLIASQTQRNFYSISAANVVDGFRKKF